MGLPVDSLFKSSAQAPIVAAVQELERHTSAEVVVSACREAGSYTDLDLAVGAVVALGTLVALLYVPAVFPLYAFPLNVGLAFGIGAAVGRYAQPFRKALAGSRRRAREAERAAKVAFFDQGVSATRDRTGILVHIAGFEDRVTVLTDLGVDETEIQEAWQSATAQLQTAMDRDDLKAFTEALKDMGPLLATILPRAEDDENELPDGLLTA